MLPTNRLTLQSFQNTFNLISEMNGSYRLFVNTGPELWATYPKN